jgi:hypothetical protein
METFLSTHRLFKSGPPAAGVPGELPPELKELLNLVGTSTYADGFFTFVAPPTFDRFLGLAGIAQPGAHVFLKCGFGQLLFWHQQQYKVLHPVFNEVDELGEDLDFVMDTVLCDRPGMENSFMLDVFEQSFPRLGPPTLDEIYSFVPALKLGGPRDAANVRRSRMDVELPILLQL